MCPHTATYVSSYCYKSNVLVLLVLRQLRDLYRPGRRAEESAASERISRKEIQAELDAMNEEHKRLKAESILPPSEASGHCLSSLSGLIDSQCSKCHTQSLPNPSVTPRDSSHLEAVARGGDKNKNDKSLVQLRVRCLLRENAECRAEIRQLGDEVFAFVCLYACHSVGPLLRLLLPTSLTLFL